MGFFTALLITFTSFSLVSCSDSNFTASDKEPNSAEQTTTKRTQKDKPDTETKVTEPSVIIGAYLTCSHLASANAENASYGCALMSQENRKFEPPVGTTLDFIAQAGQESFVPHLQAQTSPYHVIFETPKFSAHNLVVGAQIRPISSAPTNQSANEMPFKYVIPRNIAPVALALGPPEFNINQSSWVRYNTELVPVNLPTGHTVHWTYSNDPSESIAKPTCNSARFGEEDGKIQIRGRVKFKAIQCSADGKSSEVRQLEFGVKGGKCSC